MNNRWNPKLILEDEEEDNPFDFETESVTERRYDQRTQMWKTGFLAFAITIATFVFGGIFCIGLATLVHWLLQMKG